MEFRDFFARTLDVERVGLIRKGYLQAPLGMIYAVVFIGDAASGFRPASSCLPLQLALSHWTTPGSTATSGFILCWMIDGVGVSWTKADLEATGRLYRVPAAG